MSISEKLGWEIQAQNDRGEASARQRLALEICYGVALAQDEMLAFTRTMNTIREQVSDQEMKRLLALYTARGLTK